MAKRSGVQKKSEKAKVTERGSGPLQTTMLGRARAARSAGDFRTARALASEALAHGSEGEREEARRLLQSLSFDPFAIVAAMAVLAAIAVAAILALFHGR